MSKGPEPAEVGVTEDDLRTSARRVLADLEKFAAGTFRPPGPLRSVFRLVVVSIFLVGQTAFFAVYLLWRAMRWPASRIVTLFRGD